MSDNIPWDEQVEDLTDRYQDLLRRLESLAEHGIFPQSRSAAYGILKDHSHQFGDADNEHSTA